MSYDTIIVGAGPAGLSCALELHDSKVHCLVLERENRIGGQLWSIDHELRNFAGSFAQNGTALAKSLSQLTALVSLDVQLNSQISEIDLKAKTVTVGGKILQGKSLVLATGVRTRELQLPDMARFEKDIFYQIEGKEAALKGRTVAIVGGGDNALMDCLICSADCPQITLIHRSNKLTARPDVIQSVTSDGKIKMLLSARIEELIGAQRLSALKVRSLDSGQSMTVPAERLVIKIGYTPNTELFNGLIDMDKAGYILIDRFCETSVPGVFAIGDLTSPNYPRIATAAGHGAICAHRIRALVENAD